MTVTTFDTIASITRVGGIGATLNVGPNSSGIGSDYLYSPPVGGFLGGGGTFQGLLHEYTDLCIGPDGALWAVHCERDNSTLAEDSGTNYTPTRGPYVHRWNGSSWVLVAGGAHVGGDGELDTRHGFVPSSGTDIVYLSRMRPRICTDGTDVWVSYVTFSTSEHLGSGGVSYVPSWVRWRAGSATWDAVKDYPYAAATPSSSAIPAATIWPFICAHAGVLYTSFFDRPTSVSDIFIFNDNILIPNTHSVFDAFTQADCPCIVNSGGVPVVVVPRYDSSLPTSNQYRISLVNMITGAILSTTIASSLTPDGPPRLTDISLIEYPISRAPGNQILVMDFYHGPLLTPDNGSGPFVGVGGADQFALPYPSAPAGRPGGVPLIDPTDPRKIWYLETVTSHDSEFESWMEMDVWDPPCWPSSVTITPHDPAPAYRWRQFTYFPDGVSLPPVDDDGYTFPAFGAQGVRIGTMSAVMVGDHIYVIMLYAPDSTVPTPAYNQSQFVVYDIAICRDCGTCPPASAPVFGSKSFGAVG